MVETQRRRHQDESVSITSAAQLAPGASWQGIRTTALAQVEEFCRKQGLNPAQFMSNMGWMGSDRWKRGVDWKECVDWNRFNNMIFNNIEPGHRGLAMRAFRRSLEESQETYVQNATPRPAAAAQRQETARRQEEQGEHQEQAPAREARPTAAPQTLSVGHSQSDEIMDRYPMLTDEHRTAIHNILDRAAPENRRLVEMNLQTYLRFLSDDQHVLTPDEAGRLRTELTVVAQGTEQAVLAGRRGSTLRMETPNRAAPPAPMMAERGEEAPARQETYVYRFTVGNPAQGTRDNPGGVISTFEVSSPRELSGTGDLMEALRNPPAGMTVTRIANDGRRIDVGGNAEQMRTLVSRMDEISRNPALVVTLTEQERGTQG
jgi:hypothetical protein